MTKTYREEGGGGQGEGGGGKSGNGMGFIGLSINIKKRRHNCLVRNNGRVFFLFVLIVLFTPFSKKKKMCFFLGKQFLLH